MRPGDPFQVGPQAIVACPETESSRVAFEMDGGGQLVDLAPRDSRPPAAADPTGEATDPPRPLPPLAGPDEERHDLRGLPGAALDLEVVDVPTPSPVLVEQLTIHEVQPDVELAGRQFWPAFVRIISGIAVIETARMTTRYRSPSVFASRPLP